MTILHEHGVGFSEEYPEKVNIRSSNQKEYYQFTVWSYYPMTPGERKRHAIVSLGVDSEPRYSHV
ncbi:hypothetical protein BM92_01630 [Haloferax mediterranei ATCC 33500]|uniref:Uncharacterized protein n=1 Tax=Haloferax mediterranei (strain ATCC 33500 / DSM 1411 / JCM 8866 / NBRC 14739 / NCIMB 2177 / R-4) TaxID=523841 RepID=A0A059TPG1_HALMT|nr:hypothetical protein BM92_01630 [Haloferax mediterranei ATCC 33500]